MPSREKVVIKISGLQPLKNKVISWLHSISILGKLFQKKKKKIWSMPSRKKVVIKISGLQPLKNKVISWLHSISILGKLFQKKKKKNLVNA